MNDPAASPSLSTPPESAPHRDASPVATAGVIARLPMALINQIAAGEVVTRPAAALKELIENAIDAGATRIEIAVEEDALGFSVRDDGIGMGEPDLRLAVERYATSKIREYDDLHRLSTRGFRGEALAALAAVSRLEILTRARGTAEAWRLKVSGGGEPRLSEAAAPEGTTILVRDLFYNTPARLKFLKSAVAEWGHMLQAILRQSLTRPDLAFAVRWRGRPYLTLPAGQPLRERLAQILPSGAGGELIEIAGELHDVRVWGAVTGPRATRRDRRHQFFFANGRPIAFRPLQFALEEAFRGLIMTQQYPMGAVLVELPGEMIDVNVHPTKEEVRFRNESLVCGAVHRAMAEALRAADLVPMMQIPVPGERPGALPSPMRGLGLAPGAAAPGVTTGGCPEAEAAPFALDGGSISSAPAGGAAANAAAGAEQLDFVPGWALEGVADAGGSSGERVPETGERGDPGVGARVIDATPANASAPGAPGAPVAGGAADAGESPGQTYAEPAAREEAGLLRRLRALEPPPRALGQVAGTYILVEAGAAALLVVDQHAAHEKILYLHYLEAAEQASARVGAIEVQPLLVPHSIELAPGEAPVLEGLLPALRAAGFDIEPFGGTTFLVQAIPVVFERLDVAAFLRDLIDDVGQGDFPKELRRLRERICARAACRAAVKAGDPLTHAEMQRLLSQLLETDQALRCPHGRPTVLLMTREALDRQFGRI